MFPLQKAPSSINHCWTETWLAGRDEMERGGGMGMWRKGSEVNRKKKKNWKEKNRGRQKEKGLRAKSKRRSGLFAHAWTWRVSIHASAANAPLSQRKIELVQKSGRLMKSGAESLLGHCLQMSNPSEKKPLHHATACLVSAMKYEHSV